MYAFLVITGALVFVAIAADMLWGTGKMRR